MPTPPSVRSTVMATTSLVLLTLGSGKAFAAPIDLGNDVNVDWQNELFCAEQAQDVPRTVFDSCVRRPAPGTGCSK